MRLDVVTEDPADNRILECAVTAGSDYIVTGDKDLPRLGTYDANESLVKTRLSRCHLAWDNGLSIRFMPKRYTSRELVKLAEEFGWRLVGVKGDHHNFKHPASRFIVTIVHPQKDVPVGRAVDTVKKIRLELK